MSIPGEDEFDLRLDYEFSPEAVQRALDVEPSDIEAEDTVTFCKNIFLPLTTACRYTCTYCTYFDVPGEATLMSEEELRSEFDTARKAGCREALFTFGDKPDDRYEGIHETLEKWGYDDILSYLYDACQWALAHGLLPHSNPGDLTYDEMKRLKEVNASMGVMLETTADVDAHSGPRVKQPAQRLRTLEFAGELKIPFTTGILVGIGENWKDRAESLLAIKQLEATYGHVQEVIVQPVVPNERSDFETPPVEDVRRVVAMARCILPDTVEVQVPPNLYDVGPLMDCGIGDLGGVSPVTDDYINPDYKWPALRDLEDLADEYDFNLVERGPLYESYRDRDGWVSDRIEQFLINNDYEKGATVAHG
jgi:FO synthase subunit 1